MKSSYTKFLGAFASNGGRRSAPTALPQSWLARLSAGRGDEAVLGEVTQLLQACKSRAEVCNVARSRLQGISPELSGALYLASTAGEYLENVMTWGTMAVPPSEMFAPDDCWALRCGRPHLVDNLDNLVTCAHAHSDEGFWRLCVPLMAQGEALGVLYFCAHPNGGSKRTRKVLTSQARLLFYLNFAETLALALANIRLRESLQHQAIRDPLTNLFNRRYMQETLAREIPRVARTNEPLTILAIDIDHFKRFNDDFGHDAGDEVLKGVAEILQNRTRAGDLACRCGGEEFTLVYPGMSAEVAIGRAEAIRHEIETREFQFRGKPLGTVTISTGIALYPDHAMEMDSLLHVADQALYQSKKAGRNRFTMATAPSRPQVASETAPIKLVHSMPAQGRNKSVVGE